MSRIINLPHHHLRSPSPHHLIIILDGQDTLLEQLERELKDVERQIADLVNVLPQVEHKRALLERLDRLEADRITVETRLAEERQPQEPVLFELDGNQLKNFLTDYRANLESGEPERKKAILRSIIDHGVYDGETLEINPSYASITGVNLASPRGFEPLLPP